MITLPHDEMERRKQAMQDKVVECILRAEKIYGKPLIHLYLGVKKWRTSGSAIGTASASGRVSFHLGYMQDEWDHCINHTAPHEAAHLIDKWVFGNWGHGPSWKRVMRDLGVEPNRLAKLSVGRKYKRKMTRYVYECDCRVWYFSGQRHKNSELSLALHGKSPYSCPKCKRKCVFTGRSCKA